jgi:hypothetical protein
MKREQYTQNLIKGRDITAIRAYSWAQVTLTCPLQEAVNNAISDDEGGVSETIETNSTFTRLITRESFTAFSRRESFKTYTV